MLSDDKIHQKSKKSHSSRKCTNFIPDPKHHNRCLTCQHRHRTSQTSHTTKSTLSSSGDPVSSTSSPKSARSLIIRKSVPANPIPDQVVQSTSEPKVNKLFTLHQLTLNPVSPSTPPAMPPPPSVSSPPPAQPVPHTSPSKQPVKKSSFRERTQRRSTGNLRTAFSDSGSDEHSGSSKTMTIYEEDDSPEAAAEAPRQRSVSNAVSYTHLRAHET